MAALGELSFHRRGINVLQEPEAEHAVDGVERADDRSSERFLDKQTGSGAKSSAKFAPVRPFRVTKSIQL